MVDALAWRAEEGRWRLRKAPVRCQPTVIPGDVRMGKPTWRKVQVPAPEHIGRLEGTWGSETSQYPQEERTTVIPVVVASETGRG